MNEICSLNLTALADALQKKEIGAEEATRACLDRIAATEERVGALLHVDAEGALARARQLDAQGPDASQPLWGVPVTVKDALSTQGMPTTAGSRILEGYMPVYDAFAVQRLREAGAVILGKNNLDEFAMGSTTENSAYKTTHNPWDLQRVPGGSSGGSAASVAACQCFASLGSDTGGSIRQPASLCGCVGIKPTYGRVSRYGLLAYASSFDQVGPLARTVEDTALMLQVIAGHDERDSTSSPVPVPDYAAAMNAQQDLSGITVGLPREFFGHDGLDRGVAEACEKAVEAARSLGAKVVEVSLPHTEYSIASYYILAAAEASSNLARYDGVRYGHRTAAPKNLEDMYTSSRTEGFGPEVQRRILLGSYVLSAGYYDAYYRKAAQVRRLIRQDYLNALESCDMLLAPVSPVPAWQMGHMSEDPLQMYFMDIFTLSLNLAGLPGLSIPVGMSGGLPVGVQLMGRAFDEGRLFLAGDKLTRALGTHNLRAPL